MPSNYKMFVQRFTELFDKEVECPDQDSTLQTIITLMNKCGLQEYLDGPRIQASVPSRPSINGSSGSSPAYTGVQSGPVVQYNPGAQYNPVVQLNQSSPGTHYSVDQNTVGSGGTRAKRLNGFHLWQRERKQAWIDQGKVGMVPNYHGEWKEIPSPIKRDYKEKARQMFG